MSIPKIIFNIAFLYAFFAFAAYTMFQDEAAREIHLYDLPTLAKEVWSILMQAISIPVLTPWYLAGIGVVVFNIFVNLNLAVLKKSEFELQCRNN